MNGSSNTYTYRCGKKIALNKSPNQVVVRALPDELIDEAIVRSEQVSSASTLIRTSDAELESLMARSRQMAPTHHAYFDAQSGSEFLITDRVFVSFADGATDDDADALAGRYGLIRKASYGGGCHLFQLTNHTGMNPVKLVVKLTEDEPLVRSAEHDLNQRVSKYQFHPPSDPDYARQWHLHTAFNDLDYDTRSCALCEDAWRLLDSHGNDAVTVAVSDDGCRLDHADFDSPGKFAGWGYFQGSRLVRSTDFDADPQRMYEAGSNHGTSCCGVIGGEIDATFTVGAAPGCKLLPIKWESSGPSLFISDSKLLTALNYIADKADVMSNSWGSVPTSLWAQPVLDRLTTLATTGGRRGKGIVFLWAAGNENCPISHTASEPVPYDHGVDVQGGALVWVGVNTAQVFSNNLVGIPGVAHIAALASTARRSHYSNYGPGIELCAPSNNVHTYYRMSVRGLGITTTTGDTVSVTNDFGGTSSATPLVAGVAALTISANPELSAVDVISILKQTASRDLDFTAYARTPPASYDMTPTWDVSPIAPFDDGQFTDGGGDGGTWSPWFGHGRVDAAAAVTEALSRVDHTVDRRFNASSSPDRSIPDNSSRGVKDTIVSDGDFSITEIAVGIDITHTYVGDLLITLTSPSGTQVVLHDRSGGSSNDIHVQFDLLSAPALGRLIGEPADGTWTLHVRDLASIDRGRLQGWSLDIGGRVETSTHVQESPGIIIPDDASGGIDRSLTVVDAGVLDDIEVDVDITHTYVGDLIVELGAPDGASVRLHDRSGGSNNNVIRNYTTSNTTALQTLRGRPIAGDWTLHVSDHAEVDQGKLNRWGLTLVSR